MKKLKKISLYLLIAIVFGFTITGIVYAWISSLILGGVVTALLVAILLGIALRNIKGLNWYKPKK